MSSSDKHEHRYQPLLQPSITDEQQRVMLYCVCGDVISVKPRIVESGAGDK